MDDKCIGEGYISKIWPDDSSMIEPLRKKIAPIFRNYPQINDPKVPFVMVGYGCGPDANKDSFLMFVEEIRKINVEKIVMIYLIDFSENIEQQTAMEQTLKDYKNVYVFIKQDSFYSSNFPENYVDFVFGASVFSYPDSNCEFPDHWKSFAYDMGFENDPIIYKIQNESLKSLMNVVSSYLKVNGLMINIEFGGHDNETIDKAQIEVAKNVKNFFLKSYDVLASVSKKNGMTLKGGPLIFRNKSAFINLFDEEKLPFEVIESENVYDEDSFGNYASKICNGDNKLIDEMLKSMHLACDGNFLNRGEKSAEDWKKCMDEYLDEYLYSFTKEERFFTGGIVGNLVIIKKVIE
jgi:hypothetical protein